MNYIIEDDFDFFKELNDINKNTDDTSSVTGKMINEKIRP